MPPLQVRDLPQEIYEPFKRITELEHRSLAQQTIVALEYYLENHEVRDGKVVEKGTAKAVSFMPFEREGVTYMVDPGETEEERRARLEALFGRIRARKPLPVLEGYESIADMIRKERESRSERVLTAAEEGPWR